MAMSMVLFTAIGTESMNLFGNNIFFLSFIKMKVLIILDIYINLNLQMEFLLCASPPRPHPARLTVQARPLVLQNFFPKWKEWSKLESDIWNDVLKS